MRDIELMADGVIAAAKGYVNWAVAGVIKRIDELATMAAVLDQRIAAIPSPQKGEPGTSAYQLACLGGFAGSEKEWLESLRGKDAQVVQVDYERVERKLADLVQAVAAGLVPKDGKDADPEFIRAEVAKAVDAIPTPKDGKDADPAEIALAVADAVAAIPKPKDADPVNYVEIAAGVKLMVAEAVAAIPTPRDGKDADMVVVREWIVGEVGAEIVKLPRPKDGKDADPEAVIRLVKGEVAQAILLLPHPKDGEPGKSVTIDDVRGLVDGVIRDEVSRLPVPKDGVDGLGFDDMSVEHDGARDFTLRFARGEQVKEFKFSVPVVLDRGVWREGPHAKGDGVTWDGSFWIAQQETIDKPGTSAEWRLAVKKGRDGKDWDAPKPTNKQVVRLR